MAIYSTVAKCLELEPVEKDVLSKFDEALRDAVLTLMLDARADGLDVAKLNHLSTSVLMTVAADIAVSFSSACDDGDIEQFAEVSRDAIRWALEKRSMWRTSIPAD